MKKNYYDILGVTPEANLEEIREGHRRAKNTYSKDNPALYSLITKEESEEHLNLIDEAYSIISDPAKRRQYDQAQGRPLPPVQEEVVPSSPRPPENLMKKIMATKRFTLEHDIDPEMEKEIEGATEFTGPFLQKIREYKNVDIIRLCEMTKISKTYLRKIEQEDLSGLPALAYVRGFVYQYAKCLKLDPELVANSYLERIKDL